MQGNTPNFVAGVQNIEDILFQDADQTDRSVPVREDIQNTGFIMQLRRAGNDAFRQAEIKAPDRKAPGPADERVIPVEQFVQTGIVSVCFRISREAGL